MRQQSRKIPVECDVRSLLKIVCLRRVHPCLHFCLDSSCSFESLLACPASEQVRPCASRSHAFALSQASGWQARREPLEGRSGRRKSSIPHQVPSNLSLGTIIETRESTPRQTNNRASPKTCPHQLPTAPTPPLPQQQMMPATLLVSSARSSAPR